MTPIPFLIYVIATCVLVHVHGFQEGRGWINKPDSRLRRGASTGVSAMAGGYIFYGPTSQNTFWTCAWVGLYVLLCAIWIIRGRCRQRRKGALG